MSRFTGRIRDFNEASDDWTLYREMLDHHFIANGIIDEQLKKSILLSAIDIKTYKLLTTLTFPHKPGAVPFGQLCDLLAKHLRPITQVFRERAKFYACRKEQKESVTEYYTRLQRLASKCDFDESSLETKFLDKFVTGFGDGEYFERLCSQETNLNISRALTLALDVEDSMKSEMNHRIKSAQSLNSLNSSRNHLWSNGQRMRITANRLQSKVCNQCINERKTNGQYNHSYCIIKDKVDLLKLNYVSKRSLSMSQGVYYLGVHFYRYII